MANTRSDASPPPSVRKRLRQLETKVVELTATVVKLTVKGFSQGGPDAPATGPKVGSVGHYIVKGPPLRPGKPVVYFSRPKRVKLARYRERMLARAPASEAEVLVLTGGLIAADPGTTPRPVLSPAAAPAPTGLAGALRRGEAALVNSVKIGELVPAEKLAEAWGLTRQALSAAAQRGEVFAIKVSNRAYCPAVLLSLPRESVGQVCRALGSMDALQKFVFWTREHGALGGKSVVSALESGRPLAPVVQLAQAWARERGVSADPAVAPNDPPLAVVLHPAGTAPGAPG